MFLKKKLNFVLVSYLSNKVRVETQDFRPEGVTLKQIYRFEILSAKTRKALPHTQKRILKS